MNNIIIGAIMVASAWLIIGAIEADALGLKTAAVNVVAVNVASDRALNEQIGHLETLEEVKSGTDYYTIRDKDRDTAGAYIDTMAEGIAEELKDKQENITDDKLNAEINRITQN